MDNFRNSLHSNSSLIHSAKGSPTFALPPMRPSEDFQFGADNSFVCPFSSPFDWNDEQLRDLLESENWDSGDHVVPYPYHSERNIPATEGAFFINHSDAKASNIKSGDRKRTVDLHNTKHAANEAFSASVVDSWPDLSSSHTTKVNRDSSCALESNNTSGTLDGMGDLDSDSGFFQKLDDNVANMEILDDLDNILSNDNTDLCQPSSQKLGLASEDVTSIPEKSIPLQIDPPCLGLRGMRDKSETKAEYMLVQNQHWTRGCDEMNVMATPNMSQAFPEPFVKKKIASEIGAKLDNGFAVIPDSSLDEVFLEGNGSNQLQDLFRYWPMSFDKPNNDYMSMNQSSPSVVPPEPAQLHYNPKSMQYPSVILPQPRQLHYNFDSMPYPAPKLASSVSIDFASQYTMPVLSQFQDEQVYQQSVPCSSYVSTPDHSNSLKTLPDRPTEGLAMSPRKKIEKLRRQQQTRAMLAVQKLQQQFSDQVVSTDHSGMACGNFFVEANSHLERNDSNIGSSSNAADDNTAVSILHQLLEIIVKLEPRMKLNIRDSFFRLAQNARQRQYGNNTSGMNMDSNVSIVNKEDIRNSKVETETNRIDRAVAHLLFHQPLALPEKPQLSEKLYYESKPSGSLSFAR